MTQRLHWIYIVAILILYLGFHNSYRTEYVDDSWTLSWFYDFWYSGILTDDVGGFGQYAGTVLFSRTSAYVYGLLQDMLGWSRGVSYGISTSFLLVGAAIWYFILRRIGYSRELCISFILVMLLAEAYYGMGHKARVDAVTFFLSSTSFFLFIRKQYFFSGLLVLIAFENHVMGTIAFFYIFAWLVSNREEIRNDIKPWLKGIALFIVGCSAGLCYYLLLHFQQLSIFGELLGMRTGGNALIAYYFLMKYSWRHIPELLLILFTFGWFLQQRYYRKDLFIPALFLCSFTAFFLMPRGNYHYVVYAYPSAFLLILYTFREKNLLPLILGAFLVFQLPQYGYLFWKQRGYDHEEYVQKVREHVPDDDLFIYGNPNAWFALQGRDFHMYDYWLNAEKTVAEYPEEFILIENRQFREWGMLETLNNETKGIYQSEEISEFFEYDGSPVKVKRYRRLQEKPKGTVLSAGVPDAL